jgi:hypothetical protein
MEVLTIFKKHGRLKIFLDWGNNGQDYECLYHGMQKARLVASSAKRARTPPFMVVHAQKTAECRSFRPPPALGSFTSNDIPRADGSISKMAQYRCGCDHDNTSDQCLLLQTEEQPNTREDGKLFLSHLSKTRYQTQKRQG